MPRYHFNSLDGRYCPDPEGEELPDDRTAQLFAVRVAGDVMASEPHVVWDHGQWSVEVTDEHGVLLFTVMTVAISSREKFVSGTSY